jgi:hypothetical protein
VLLLVLLHFFHQPVCTHPAANTSCVQLCVKFKTLCLSSRYRRGAGSTAPIQYFCVFVYPATTYPPQLMPDAPGKAPGGRRRALPLPPPVLAACPAPPELEEPEPLLLPVGPAARELSWRRAVRELP